MEKYFYFVIPHLMRDLQALIKSGDFISWVSLTLGALTRSKNEQFRSCFERSDPRAAK